MSPLSNKTRLYEALGQIVVSFKALEQGIDGLILCSLDSPIAQGAILIGTLSFPQKITTMNELIRSLHTEQELGALHHTLEALVERGHACAQQRNHWIRSYWVPEVDAEPGVVMRLQRTEDVRGFALMPVNIAELESFIVVLNATVAYLNGFHQKLANNFKRIQGVQAAESLLKTPRLAGQV